MSLDPSLNHQLTDVFSPLKTDVTLTYRPSAHPKHSELLTLLNDVADCSAHIRVIESGTHSEIPQVAVSTNSHKPAIIFSGIPGGHEFSSFILAILNSAGLGKFPDEGLQRQIRSINGPVRLKTFISLSCESCPEVVQAINLMAIIHPDFSHEMIDGELALNEIERLKIQGVPAVFSGDTLISSGKAELVDLIAALSEKLGVTAQTESVVSSSIADVTIIGGGPAGVSAAIYAARKGISTVLIADRIGGQLQDTRGIENLISVPYTEGPELSAKLEHHLTQYDVKIMSHRKVSLIAPQNNRFEVTTSGGEIIDTASVILATGAKWRELNVPGEKNYLGRGVAYCPHCDGPFFKGRPVAVIGGGNSGIEAAIDLSGIVKHVTIVEFMPELKADAVLVTKAKSLPNISIITNARVTEVLGNESAVTGIRYEERSSGQRVDLPIDGIFVQIGLVPNSQLVKDLVNTTPNGEIKIDTKCRTSYPGIYAAGDVTTVPYKQIVVAVGEGAKAALSASEARH